MTMRYRATSPVALVADPPPPNLEPPTSIVCRTSEVLRHVINTTHFTCYRNGFGIPATAAPTVSPTTTAPDALGGSTGSDDSTDPAVVAGIVVGVIAVLALIALVAFLRAERKKDPTSTGAVSHAEIRSTNRHLTTSADSVPSPPPAPSRQLSDI